MRVTTAISKTLKRLIAPFENTAIPFHRYLISFIAVVLLRQVLEMFSTGHNMSLAEVVHYFLWYTGTAACLIWVLQIMSGEEAAKVARAVLSAYVLVLLAPILDLLMNQAASMPMKYLQGEWGELFLHYVTLCLRYTEEGFTPGMRIEVAVVFAFALGYLMVKVRRPLRILLSLLFLYTALFSFGLVGKIAYDLYCLLFRTVGALVVTVDGRAMAAFLFPVGLGFAILVVRRASRRTFIAVARDLRLLSILHYVVVFVIGYLLYRTVTEAVALPAGGTAPFVRLDYRIFGFLLLPVGLIGAAVFSIITNNLADLGIDRIAHPGRPHVVEAVPPATYRAIGWWSLAVGLVSAALAGGLSLLFIGIIVGGYALYSLPPFRLKRIPLVGKLLIGVNTTAAAMAGFTLFGGEVTAFPPLYIAFFCGPFALASNAVDMGDVAGDRAAGIRTLPVLLGAERARWVFVLFATGAYLMMGLILADVQLVVPLVVLAAAHGYAILRRPFRSGGVLLVNLLAMLALAVVLALRAAG